MPFMTSNQGPIYQPYLFKTMNERAERINGLAAMIGIVAAMGAYAVTGQVIPGIW
jgi:hypothetical protein